jgi:hypothetical protein
MPVKYKDLSKKANDALDKNYSNANSAKLSTKAANGVAYTAEMKNSGSSVSSKLSAKFKCTSGINVKKLEINNKAKVSADIALEGAVDNATFNLNVVMEPLTSPGAAEKCTVGVDYAHEKAQIGLDVSPFGPTGATVSALLNPVDNVLVGGVYAGNLNESGWTQTQLNAGLGYTSSDNVVTLTTGNSFSDFTLAAFRQHSADIAFAARVGLNSANPNSASFTVGGTYVVDADTKVNAKFDVPNGDISSSSVSVGYNQKLNSNVRLTTATKLQVGTGGPQSTGFALGLEFGSV